MSWRRKPRQRRSKVTVDSLLIAAEEQFADKGFHNTTADDIVRRAGIGIGSLYDYFPNKAAIALALLELRSGDVAEAARRVFVSGGVEPIASSLPKVIATIFQSYRANRDIFITLVNDVPELRTMAELYSVDRLINRASLLYLQMYENEIQVADLARTHAFLNIVFVASIRHYLSLLSPPMDEDKFIVDLSNTILAHLGVQPNASPHPD